MSTEREKINLVLKTKMPMVTKFENKSTYYINFRYFINFFTNFEVTC